MELDFSRALALAVHPGRVVVARCVARTHRWGRTKRAAGPAHRAAAAGAQRAADAARRRRVSGGPGHATEHWSLGLRGAAAQLRAVRRAQVRGRRRREPVALRRRRRDDGVRRRRVVPAARPSAAALQHQVVRGGARAASLRRHDVAGAGVVAAGRGRVVFAVGLKQVLQQVVEGAHGGGLLLAREGDGARVHVQQEGELDDCSVGVGKGAVVHARRKDVHRADAGLAQLRLGHGRRRGRLLGANHVDHRWGGR